MTRESTDPTLHPPAGMRVPTEPTRPPPASAHEPTDPAVTALNESTPGTDPLRFPPQGLPEVAAAQEVQQTVRTSPEDVNLPQPQRPEGTDKFFVPPAEQPRPEGTDRVFLGVLEGASLVAGEASKRPAQNAGEVAMPRPQAALTGVSMLEGSAWDTALSEPTPPPVVPVVSGDAPAPVARPPQSTVTTGPLNPADAASEPTGYEPTMLTDRRIAQLNTGGGEANEATMLVHRDAVAGAPPHPIARQQTPVVQRTDITKRRKRGSTIMWLVTVVFLALCLAGVAFWALKKRQAPVLTTDVVEIPVDENNLPPRTKKKAAQ